MVKSLLCVIAIALVVQGLFFSVNGSDEVKARIPPIDNRDRAIRIGFPKEGENNSPLPSPLQWGSGETKRSRLKETLHFEQARKYADRGLVDLAIPELQKITELYPDNAEAHAYLGWAYSQKGLITEAARELQKVLEINPDLQKMPFDFPMSKTLPSTVRVFTENLEGMIPLVSGFSGAHELLGLCYVMQGRLGDALNAYKKILEPESCSTGRVFAVDCKKTLSVIDQAIREYEDDVRERPDYVAVYLKLACAYSEKGAMDMAVETIKKALSLEPDSPETHVYLSCFHAKKGMLDEAIKELAKARQWRDHRIEKLVTEAECFLRDGMFDKAISVAGEIASADSRNKKALWLLAMAYGKKGDMAKAVNVCKEAIGLYPDDVGMYALAGWIYAQHDLFTDAMYLAEQAMQIAPEHADILALMAFIYASQNQLYEATALCNRMSEKAQETHVHSTNYGWVKGGISSLEQKLREALDVLETNPDYAEAYLCLGWLYSKNGEPEKAIDAFIKVIELTPDSYHAHLYLGNMYMQRGDIKNAIAGYGKALEIVSRKAQDAIALGLEAIKKGDSGRAIDYFNEALQIDTECGEAYALLANAYEKKGLYHAGMFLRLHSKGLDKAVNKSCEKRELSLPSD